MDVPVFPRTFERIMLLVTIYSIIVFNMIKVKFVHIVNSLIGACCLQVLSVQQLYRVCTLYWDDDYNTQSVSPDVRKNH